MLTAVVSDLHLGSSSSTLGIPAVRHRLLTELDEADQLVLLGDVLALRAGPTGEILERARPFLQALGETMAGRRIVIVPGNHDHALTKGLPEALTDWLGSCELAYPGVWIRPDVYAMHGHYLDCHFTVPRVETLCAAAMQSLVTPLAQSPGPDDYEAVLAPVYAFADALAQHGGQLAPKRVLGGGVRYLVSGADPSSVRAKAALALAGTAVAGLNRSGLGRFSTDMSPSAIRRAGMKAMGEVVSRLELHADHVIFGHTHASSPLPGESPWELPNGTRLTNSGSWVYAASLISSGGAADPYWPGTCVMVGERGDPQLRPLLAELAAPVAA